MDDEGGQVDGKRRRKISSVVIKAVKSDSHRVPPR